MALQFDQINAPLAFPDGTVWLAENEGLIFKKQGELWKPLRFSATQYLSGMVGSDPNEVWIAFAYGRSRGVVHCQNETCNQIPLDEPLTAYYNRLVQTDTQDLWFY